MMATQRLKLNNACIMEITIIIFDPCWQVKTGGGRLNTVFANHMFSETAFVFCVGNKSSGLASNDLSEKIDQEFRAISKCKRHGRGGCGVAVSWANILSTACIQGMYKNCCVLKLRGSVTLTFSFSGGSRLNRIICWWWPQAQPFQSFHMHWWAETCPMWQLQPQYNCL